MAHLSLLYAFSCSCYDVYMNSKDFLQDVIDAGIDMGRLKHDCLMLIKEFKARTLQDDPDFNFTRPYSILLTEAPEGKADEKGLIKYDELNEGGFFDRDSRAILKVDYESTYLSVLVDRLPFKFSIIRLSVLPPTTIIRMHKDLSPHAQLAIETNEESFVVCGNGETCQVPEDGRIYVFSTTLSHTAFNASDKERVHLSISVYRGE